MVRCGAGADGVPLIEYLIHAGATYELTILALAHESGTAVEGADLTATGGTFAEARVCGSITLVHQEPMPVEVYSWWTNSHRTCPSPAMNPGRCHPGPGTPSPVAAAGAICDPSRRSCSDWGLRPRRSEPRSPLQEDLAQVDAQDVQQGDA